MPELNASTPEKLDAQPANQSPLSDPRPVHYMQIITHTGAISGGIVTTKHIKFISFAYSDLCNKGQKIIGNTLVLANITTAMKLLG